MSELRAENLMKKFKERVVVNRVSFKVRSNQIVGLLGPNGAGKTTSFYIIVGLLKPNEGKIFLDNADITELPMYLKARQGISYLPQEVSVFRKLTVEQNIFAVLENMPLTKGEREQRLEELLHELNIAYVATNKAYSLSGGERRRVEIARALATNPKFILLDEPFAGIDPIAVFDLQKIIKGLKEKGIGVLITDHNVRETLGICDFSYLLKDGNIQQAGTSKELAASPLARETYLGEHFKL